MSQLTWHGWGVFALLLKSATFLGSNSKFSILPSSPGIPSIPSFSSVHDPSSLPRGIFLCPFSSLPYHSRHSQPPSNLRRPTHQKHIHALPPLPGSSRPLRCIWIHPREPGLYQSGRTGNGVYLVGGDESLVDEGADYYRNRSVEKVFLEPFLSFQKKNNPGPNLGPFIALLLN